MRFSSHMFNTGDIVRWQDDGSLETFGRVDDQVKIKVNTLYIYVLSLS
jgi:non-ribosomal peptide synthetase component F